MSGPKTPVLFLCSMNSCRSQMAEGFLRQFGSERYDAYSAGIEASEVNPRAIQVMGELGIDISNQTSDTLADMMRMRKYHAVISVCAAADEQCPTFLAPPVRVRWAFDDPAAASGTEEEIMAEFRRVRDQIKEAVLDLVENGLPLPRSTQHLR